MQRGVIYTRLSAKSKGERNAPNLDAQEVDCRKLADDLGAVLVAPTLRDYGESAFDRDNPDDRPAYAELCDLVRSGAVDVVFAWHTDRLWRNDLEKALFIRDAPKAGLRLIRTMTAKLDPENPDDNFTLDILTAVAKKESADKRRRIKRKMQTNAEAGLPHGPQRPFGYDDDKITIRKSEAKIVREVAKRLLCGDTVYSVVKWANKDSGVTPVRGGIWTSTQVRNIVINPRYAGLRATGRGKDARVVGPAVWKAILSRTDHDKLRVLLLDPDRRTNRSARTYLLSGLLRCELCGHTLISRARHDNRRKTAKTRTYACNTDPGSKGCGGVRIVAEQTEHVVVAALGQHVASDAFRKGLVQACNGGVDETVIEELADLDARDATLAEQWANGTLTDAAWASARKTLMERRARVTATIRKTARVPGVLAEYVDDPTRIAHDFPTMPFDRQRAVITTLLESVTIAKAGPGVHRFDMNRVTDVRWRDLNN